MKQLDKVAPTDIDLDAIGSDVDSADECHQHRPNLVWRERCEFVGDLATACDEAFLGRPISVFVVDGIEDCSLIGKEGSNPGDDQSLEIGGGSFSAIFVSDG